MKLIKQPMQTLIAYFAHVPGQLRKRKWLVWAFFIAATAFQIVGIGRARFDASIEGWFEESDPTIVAFNAFHQEFGSEDHLYIVYKPKDGSVFSEKSLKTLKALQDEINGEVAKVRAGDGSPFGRIVKLTSLINAPVLKAEGDNLISRKLVGNEVPGDPARLEEIRKVAESQQGFRLRYFSKDYHYGGILVETNFGALPLEPAKVNVAQSVNDVNLDDPTATPGGKSAKPAHIKFKPTEMPDYIALMDKVKLIMAKPQYADHFEYYPVGNTATAEYNLAMVKELGMLNLAALLIMMVLLWFLFRSFSAVVWPITIVVLSSIWMVGITAWCGYQITSFVMIAIMLTLSVGVADTVHVLAGYLSARNEGEDHATAMEHCFRHVAVASLLTTLINIVAVLSLSITPIVPIIVFACMCTLGVGLPLMFSIYLFPLMLDLWAPTRHDPDQSSFLGRLIPHFSAFLTVELKKVLPFVERRPVAIMVVFLSIFAACIFGSLRTQVDTDPVGAFPPESKIRQSVKVVDKNMMGAQSMEIFFDLGKENAFHDPFVLHTMDDLQKTIERKYGRLVVNTVSLVDTVKQSYQTLNGDQKAFYVIPDSTGAVSQTLFLFNQSNPEDRRKLVSDNYNRAHISVRLYSAGSFEYAKTWDAMRGDIDQAVARLKTKYPQTDVSITGLLALLMQGADYLTVNELQSFGLSLILISVILLVLFGSVKAGLIALIPNLIPAILAYGALGLLGIPLDITTMMIAPIVIGIAVDDTVHFVTRYRIEVSMDGDVRRALDVTLADTGQSIVFTTLILGLGFGIMSLSSSSGMRNLGIFGSLAIVVGVLNDLFLLPAMVLLFKLKFKTSNAQ